MRLRPQAHCSRSLLHRFQSIFDLVQTALGREDGVIGVVGVSELFKVLLGAIQGHEGEDLSSPWWKD